MVNATLRPPYPWERDPVPIVQEAGRVLRPIWRATEHLHRPKFDPRTLQPVVWRYTQYAIPALNSISLNTCHNCFKCLSHLVGIIFKTVGWTTKRGQFDSSQREEFLSDHVSRLALVSDHMSRLALVSDHVSRLALVSDHMSQLALVSDQPCSTGGQGVNLTTSVNLVPELRIAGDITLPLYAFIACIGHLYLYVRLKCTRCKWTNIRIFMTTSVQ